MRPPHLDRSEAWANRLAHAIDSLVHHGPPAPVRAASPFRRFRFADSHAPVLLASATRTMSGLWRLEDEHAAAADVCDEIVAALDDPAALDVPVVRAARAWATARIDRLGALRADLADLVADCLQVGSGEPGGATPVEVVHRAVVTVPTLDALPRDEGDRLRELAECVVAHAHAYVAASVATVGALEALHDHLVEARGDASLIDLADRVRSAGRELRAAA